MPPVCSPSKLTLTQIAMTAEADISTAESFLWPSELEFESRTGHNHLPLPPTPPPTPCSLLVSERSTQSGLVLRIRRKARLLGAWTARERVEKKMKKKKNFQKETRNYWSEIPGLAARICRCWLFSPTLEKCPFKTMIGSKSTENTTELQCAIPQSAFKTFIFCAVRIMH